MEALTAMFSPSNLLTNLCREIATLKHSDGKHPGESVDQYGLLISSLFTRLLAESARTTPPRKSTQSFGWERLRLLFLKTGCCHQPESNKYERTPLTRSHQREIELVNMRQIICMVSTLQICLRSCPCLPLLLKISWKLASTTFRQLPPHWWKRPHHPGITNVVARKRSAGPPRVFRTIAHLNVIRVAARPKTPARHDRTRATTNIVCAPQHTRRRIACLKSLPLRRDRLPTKPRAMCLRSFWVYRHCKHNCCSNLEA